MRLKQSLIALNGLNFFAADIATGVGPFLAIYLAANQNWTPGNIGIALSVQSFTTVIAQSPAAYLINRTKYKKAAIIVASFAIAAFGILIPIFRNFGMVITSQVIIGIAAAFYLPSLIALAACLVKPNDFDKTIGNNQSYNHAGNVVAALGIGIVGKYTSNEGVFYCLPALFVMCTVCTLLIRNSEMHTSPIVSATDKEKSNKSSIIEIFTNRPFLIFLVASFMFHFANAAMLPLVGEEISKGKFENSSLYMSACIIIAQLVMVPVTYICGRQVKKGRKWLLIIGFVVLPVRGILYTFSTNVVYLVSIQVLDGIAAGIFGVVSILVVIDLMRNSGLSIFAQGVLATVVGLGASLSNLITGFIVNSFGFKTGFSCLSILALAALFLLWFAMPETLGKEKK